MFHHTLQPAGAIMAQAVDAHQHMLTIRLGASSQVRAWLQMRAHRSGDQGLLAAQIPAMWAQDHNGSSLPLREMGVKKLSKFLLACSDIVRTARPVAAGGLHA